MKQPYLVFSLGSLEVFTLQDPPSVLGHPGWTPDMHTTNFYWRDAGSPQGYGPFIHITACMEHYRWVLTACKGDKAAAPPLAPVLRVDFRTKKRVTPTDV